MAALVSGHRIAVEYHVPVLCWVDIEEGTIDQVVQHGGMITPTGTLINADGEAFEDAGAFEVATQIADSVDWPSWDSAD